MPGEKTITQNAPFGQATLCGANHYVQASLGDDEMAFVAHNYDTQSSVLARNTDEYAIRDTLNTLANKNDGHSDTILRVQIFRGTCPSGIKPDAKNFQETIWNSEPFFGIAKTMCQAVGAEKDSWTQNTTHSPRIIKGKNDITLHIVKPGFLKEMTVECQTGWVGQDTNQNTNLMRLFSVAPTELIPSITLAQKATLPIVSQCR